MIINQFTGSNEILDPAYPVSINFAGGTYPSALHACYAAMTDDLNLRSTIAMTEDATIFASNQSLMSADVSLETIWDRVIDIQLAKFSQPSIANRLDIVVDKENDIVEYPSINPILGKNPDIASSLDMIGVTTTAIAKHGLSRQAIAKYITSGGK